MKYSIIAISIAVILLYLYERYNEKQRVVSNNTTVLRQQPMKVVTPSTSVYDAESWQLHRTEKDALCHFSRLRCPRMVVTEPSGFFFTITGPKLSMKASDSTTVRTFLSPDDHTLPLMLQENDTDRLDNGAK